MLKLTLYETFKKEYIFYYFFEIAKFQRPGILKIPSFLSFMNDIGLL